MLAGPDGRVHTTFGHNPSSLRLCSFDPNMQNIPRGGAGEDNWVKEMFVAPEGSTFWERDFSGIEAVLVGYFAGSPGYTRLAKRDVHSFYTAYALNALDPGRVLASDLPYSVLA
jgi:DNA polymerase I-like protein with 3'-5' exonuclease and polymerase domains